uniref:PDZ domain-containing protein n=1 Tax=Anopheles maculatus TaxID=74869 RepID=A0A182SHF9_9DIPT
MMAGDALIKVNGTEVFNMRHKDAQDVIVAAGNSFELTVSRGGATWRPSVTPTGSLPSPSPSLPGNITPVTRTSLAATPQEMKPIGSGHNTAAKPFAAVNGNDGQIKSIVNNQYNTPVGMYSDETIAETLSSQAEVLAGGVLGVNFKKNERVYSPANSEVYKLLHEQGDDPEPGNISRTRLIPDRSPNPRQDCEIWRGFLLFSTDTRTVTDTMLDTVRESIDVAVVPVTFQFNFKTTNPYSFFNFLFLFLWKLINNIVRLTFDKCERYHGRQTATFTNICMSIYVPKSNET